MLKLERKKTGVAEVPMAPLIDMVFLLLVFFMTASAMSQANSKRKLDLPESSEAVVPQEMPNRWVVSVDATGQCYVGGEALSLEDLERRLGQAREDRPGLVLQIRGEKQTAFASVKRVMQSAAAAGIERYVYATYQMGD